MKPKELIGAIMPRFTYDTPDAPENDFYALCNDEKPLVMIFLANFGHPITRAYLAEYFKTIAQLTSGRLVCVVRSDPRVIASKCGQVQFPFSIICDADGALYDYLGIKTKVNVLDWTFAAKKIVKNAKKAGYQPEKETKEVLPLTMVLDQNAKVLFAHYARSLTDLPEDCMAIEQVCREILKEQELDAAQSETES